ncbi:MAG: TIM barrel protein [Oscillospiraceae bacterium]|nr:TIM barrel protein [Oscillospiraceae bacterium]
MKFSLCIEPLFENVSIYDRVKLAKDAGVDAIEFWDPTPYDMKKMAIATQKLDMPVAGLTMMGAWDIRLNAQWSKLKSSLENTINAGKEVGCNKFIGLGGEVECKTDNQKNIMIDNLKRASEICEKHNVTVIIEPLNSLYDHKGYWLDSSYIGFEIVKCVNHPNIKVLYDIYHMQIMEGNIISNIINNIDFIGHFHSAGTPGRNELNKGELNYPYVIAAIEKAGYSGYFGFEYWPTYDNAKSLADVLSYVKT